MSCVLFCVILVMYYNCNTIIMSCNINYIIVMNMVFKLETQHNVCFDGSVTLKMLIWVGRKSSEVLAGSLYRNHMHIT